MTVLVQGGTARELDDRRLVQQQVRRHVFGNTNAELAERLWIRGKCARDAVLHVERFSGREEQDRAVWRGCVHAHVGKHVEQRREQGSEQRLVDERQPDPLQEGPVRGEPAAHQLEELTGVEMGRAARPRMRRLRDDHVEARRRERERAARVVQMDMNARIRERVAPTPVGDEAIGRDHLGFELDHVDPLDRWRHHLDRHAAAESHEE